MGNSSSKDERRAARPSGLRHTGAHVPTGETSPPQQLTPGDRLAGRIYAARNGSARGSRNDVSFLHIGRGERDGEAQAERPRETKQEREARRAERERQARLKERERSMREEHVDGGYLVTLGTYTGAEDFSKPIVRQLQIERRLAPFWKGLEDHNEAWTEAQLVAAARGLPIPAPDAVPPEMDRSTSQASSNPGNSDVNVNSLMVPITGRSQSYQSDRSTSLSASHPEFSTSGPASPTGLNPNNPLFRGRAKTLASTLIGKTPDISPQETQLPRNPNVNGQPLEAYLYKDATECPICFMYYPPYLNRTRCCDQPICSECFVQIKRPDPHPPEHEQPGEPRLPEEEAELLVSEVAACPFCVTPEFGVTYEPPSFRRGLAYANQQLNPLRNPTSAMSSSTSLTSPAGSGRRRATSLSANSSQVITTDRVRPDWAKKLADARAHALRRSAAATALHNAAYVLGNQGDGLRASGLIGRRRRTLFGDSPNASGSGTPHEGDSTGDLVSGRSSSARQRRVHVEDLEELMMMEAIRLSLAAEEERKHKEEKLSQKEAKKKAKADKKEEKKADRVARKNGGTLYRAGTNESSSSMARSTSNLGQQGRMTPDGAVQGKGKQPVQDIAGFNPLTEPTSTLNRPASPARVGDAQRHLEESRANLQPSAPMPIATPSPRTTHFRQLSNASSAASSFMDSPAHSNSASGVDITAGALDSSANGTPAPAASSAEPMFNFRSLTAMMSEDEKPRDNNNNNNNNNDEHLEHAPEHSDDQPSPSPVDGNRSRGDSGESSSSAPPPIYVETPSVNGDGEGIRPVEPESVVVHHHPDAKEFRGVDVAFRGRAAS